MRNAEKTLWTVAGAGFVVGLVGLVMRITGGHTVAAYNTYVPWGLWVAAYAMLIGVSAGAFLVAALAYGFRLRAVRPLGGVALVTAAASLVGGLVAVWLDLGHPVRFYKLFVSTSPTSIMGLMSWLYVVYGILLGALILLTRRDASSSAVRFLALFGLALVAVFGGAEGSLFGVVGAQALWESGLTPILFLVEGAVGGVGLVAFLTVVLGKVGEEGSRFLRRLLMGLLATLVVLEWSEFSTALYAGLPARSESLSLILFGPFWWVFWFVHVGLGVVVPVCLLAIRGLGDKGLAGAGGLVASTAISAKLNLVIPALVVPDLEGLRGAFTGMGLSYDYFPTMVEWLLSVGFVSLAGLVFLAGYRWLVDRSPFVEKPS